VAPMKYLRRKSPSRRAPRHGLARKTKKANKLFSREGRRTLVEALEDRRLLTAYDISTGPGISTPPINGAVFQSTNPASSAGHGGISSFRRVQASPTEQGFNTNAGVTLDAKGGSFTRALLYSDVPIVKRPTDGISSGQFALDINQSNPLLSLDQVK